MPQVQAIEIADGKHARPSRRIEKTAKNLHDRPKKR
jgi:phosphotransferase system HPr-like phosphotransfer protein